MVTETYGRNIGVIESLAETRANVVDLGRLLSLKSMFSAVAPVTVTPSIAEANTKPADPVYPEDLCSPDQMPKLPSVTPVAEFDPSKPDYSGDIKSGADLGAKNNAAMNQYKDLFNAQKAVILGEMKKTDPALHGQTIGGSGIVGPVMGMAVDAIAPGLSTGVSVAMGVGMNQIASALGKQSGVAFDEAMSRFISKLHSQQDKQTELYISGGGPAPILDFKKFSPEHPQIMANFLNSKAEDHPFGKAIEKNKPTIAKMNTNYEDRHGEYLKRPTAGKLDVADAGEVRELLGGDENRITTAKAGKTVDAAQGKVSFGEAMSFSKALHEIGGLKNPGGVIDISTSAAFIKVRLDMEPDMNKLAPKPGHDFALSA